MPVLPPPPTLQVRRGNDRRSLIKPQRFRDRRPRPHHKGAAVHTQPGELPAPRFYSGAARLVRSVRPECRRPASWPGRRRPSQPARERPAGRARAGPASRPSRMHAPRASRGPTLRVVDPVSKRQREGAEGRSDPDPPGKSDPDPPGRQAIDPEQLRVGEASPRAVAIRLARAFCSDTVGQERPGPARHWAGRPAIDPEQPASGRAAPSRRGLATFRKQRCRRGPAPGTAHGRTPRVLPGDSEARGPSWILAAAAVAASHGARDGDEVLRGLESARLTWSPTISESGFSVSEEIGEARGRQRTGKPAIRVW